MKQENGKKKIRVKGSRSEIMINNIKEEEMRDKNEIEDESRSIKKPKSEERNM
jgi:hypothetical protein